MLLTYCNGRSADDRLFDVPLNEQRFYVGRCLNMPAAQGEWPMSMIDHLIDLRKHEGQEAFYREIVALLSRPHPRS